MENAKTPISALCSVVCTTYNHAKYAAAAVQSIVAQDYRPIEIIIVDDGSTDDNVAVLRAALSESGLSHKLIAQENTGNVAMNANRALAAAKGQFCVLTSLDDLLLPGCISSKMAIMSENPALVMVGNSTNAEIDSRGQITKADCPNAVFGKETADAEEMREIEFDRIGTFFLQGTAFRADFLTAIGAFEEGLTGDDLILRTKVWNHLIAHPELRFVFLRRSGFAYRKHESNLYRSDFRQIRTVIDWQNRYFPDRPLHDSAVRWIRRFFNTCLANGDNTALHAALAYDPRMLEVFEVYHKTWKYRRRRIKHFVRRALGRAPVKTTAP